MANALQPMDPNAILRDMQKSASNEMSKHVKKRPHSSLDDTIQGKPLVDEDDLEPDPRILSCDKVRTLLRRLFDSGEMKVTHWQRQYGVNSNSYGRFMALKGPYTGIDNQTYDAGYRYFRRRQLEGVKDPNTNKKAKMTSSSGQAGSKGEKPRGAPDVSDISLPGDEKNSVQVFDTCDDIRRKISAFLRRNDVVQAQFLRDLGAQVHSGPNATLDSGKLKSFRSKKGPSAGATSNIFYASYVYFEKLRIKEGKPKSKKRLEMEKIWGSKGGFDTEHDASRGFWCSSDERPYGDEYGQIHFAPAGTMSKPKPRKTIP